MSEYGFRPMARADLPIFRHWLDQPHIEGWWGESGTEARMVEEDMEKNVVDMRLVCLDDVPFAYVQDYPAHHWPAPQYEGRPASARALDTFLGDLAYLGQGHAAAYLRQRALQLLAQGAASVLVDPDPANARAIAAYARAGFRPLALRPCEDGDMVQVMEFTA